MAELSVLLFGSAAAYGAAAIVSVLFADRIIFPAPPSGYAANSELRFFETEDGVRLAGQHLTRPGAEYTILYSHGNGEDLGTVRPVAEWLRDLGFSVFAYDYRGYGMSDGRASSSGVPRDAEAAYAFLTGPLGVAPDRVILYGRSLGGAPAVHLAAHRKVAGLVLEAAFTSAFRVVTRISLLPFDRLQNLALMPTIRCPVLVMHGRRDAVVPFSHGPALFAAAPEPKRHLWLDDAGHNDLLAVAEDRIAAALCDFQSILRTPAMSES